MDWTTLGLAALAAYLLGSIPFGIVVARAFGLGDIRKIGSGNIGATNVLRTGNKLAALLTLIGDAGKGAIAVVLARLWAGEAAAGVAGLFAMLGHLFPLYLGFRGGKGVATALGMLLALSFPAGLATCASWLVTAAISRYSSLSAIVAMALAPLWTGLFYHWHGAALVAVMSACVIARHHANIRRLIDGTEPRIGRKG
ncbi:glycerol-3-phosphate acyltransferase PlsY [Meinhardsimonia xiamenensis]|jgi:glycerol-3-phosphate acyltransferase PlsY|uniref:Glycerol-3-phosphate acyltransferase n=1 Tax=Meinhardsimonia xiamenensis TaxID=990712 RepID=A0A1G9ABJ7_9RHOB|nr:glycerol-3-phosphate 1-O-acyltransferase PlsY [Meinhardsimonia xiamenensis]PRX35453.1 glycerol-3-phosphate acyltransferase PlsY [Meinhardsimonia xiamenensis]SDK24739.1 glycerol-3-phosphate acyltransferase PlsY [Meinhardsimonia xiamenensis]